MQIVVAERHPLYREILRDLVGHAAPSADCMEVASMADLLERAAAVADLGLILLDLALDGMDGLTGLLRLSALHPGAPVIVVAAAEDGEASRRALVCGAAAFLPKSMSAEEMLPAIRAVLAGRCPADDDEPRLDVLTPRERVVLEALVRGRSNKQIAFELRVSDTTVRAHVSAVLRKLGVRSRTQAVIKAQSGATATPAIWPAAPAC